MMSSFFDSMRQQLGYVLSLPERTIRSLAAVATGTTTLLTDTLFPDALRGTTLYKIFIGDTQKFIVEKVAEVQREAESDANASASDPDYLKRKMVGGALETAGLFAMHFSPLWVFAIAGDAASGSSVFLKRLVAQLKKNGVVDVEEDIRGIEDLLMAIQDTSRRSASAVDTPPMSREEIGKLANEMTVSYQNMFSSVTGLVPRLDDIWGRMERIASRENVSMEKIEGILTIDVASWATKGFGAVMAVGQTGSDLFGEQILDGYTRTLDKVNEQGVTAYLNNHMQPFFSAAMSHFSSERRTLTEKMTDWLFGGGSARTEAEPDMAIEPTDMESPQIDTAADDELPVKTDAAHPPPPPPPAPPAF